METVSREKGLWLEMRKWTFGKHVLLSAVMTLVIRFAPEAIIRLMLKRSTREAASIGIIGGADGPTSIFIAEKTGITHNYRWLLVFPILLLLYVPIWLLTRGATNE